VTPSATSEDNSGVVRLIANLPFCRRFLRPPSTEAPSLHRSYPASSVLRASPPSQSARPFSRLLPGGTNQFPDGIALPLGTSAFFTAHPIRQLTRGRSKPIRRDGCDINPDLATGANTRARETSAKSFPWSEYMASFTGKRLVALALMTAPPVLPPEPSLAYLQLSDSARNAQRATAAAAIEMRTDTEGVDFGPFMQSVYRSVKREWFAAMPPSVEKGDKGIVSIQFRVQQDGKVPGDSLKVVSSSGKKEFNDAGLNAIRNVAPFDHLPSKFSQPSLSCA
jgi:TonB family protein